MQLASKSICRGKLLSSLPTVGEIHEGIAVSEEAVIWISPQREIIANILLGEDPRLLAIAGPCSIYDVQTAVEYAKRLSVLQNKHSSQMYIVMRIYFEKPRTHKGWKGIMHDPDLNGGYNVERGIRYARQCLSSITIMRVATATELFDPFLTPYIADLICWRAVGARTTESQTHRQLASGLHYPVGSRNSTDRNINSAINAILATREQHIVYMTFLTKCISTLLTDGNPHGHLILRGGREPNYGLSGIMKVVKLIHDEGINHCLIIDCSHGNSGKVAERRISVAREVIDNRRKMSGYVAGIVLENFL